MIVEIIDMQPKFDSSSYPPSFCYADMANEILTLSRVIEAPEYTVGINTGFVSSRYLRK